MTQSVNFSAMRCKYPSAFEKVERRAKSMIYRGAIAALSGSLFILTLGGTLAARLYSHHSHKSLKVDIEEAQIRSVSESLGIVLAGPNRGERTQKPQALSRARLKEGLLLASRKGPGVVSFKTIHEANKLAAKIFKIRSKIERLARAGSPKTQRLWDIESIKGGIKGLQGDLRKAMKSSLYQSIKREDCEGVNFLQFVAIKLLAADGTDALKNYGKKCLGELQDNAFSPVNLADSISSYLAKPGFAYGLGWPIWVASHPLYAMHCSKSAYNPLGFDASQRNPNFSAHSFKIGGKELKFYYSPCPTGSPIFEHGVLPAYEKFGVFELRFNHQDASNSHEYVQIQELQRIVDENPKALKHALLSFDRKMKNNKHVEFDDPGQFFARYRDYLKKGVRGQTDRKNHSGFHIPEHLLSDADLNLAVAKAQEFCEKMCVKNSHWEKAMAQIGKKGSGKERMAKIMKLITDVYLSLAMMVRTLDAVTPEMVARSLDEKLDKDLTKLRTSGACKQGIDRGVIENISLRLFFRWTENPLPLTQDEVYEIAGAVLGRARLVADRKILEKRYEILDDLLRFVGSASGGVSTAHSLLKAYREALSGHGLTFCKLFCRMGYKWIGSSRSASCLGESRGFWLSRGWHFSPISVLKRNI